MGEARAEGSFSPLLTWRHPPRSAHLFDEELVLRQLRCGGVLEAVRVFSAGYPDRMLIRSFVGRYSAIVPAAALPRPQSSPSDSTSHGGKRQTAQAGAT